MLVSELIDRTLAEWLYPGGDETPQFDTLASGIDASVLSLTLAGRAEFTPRDSILEIESEQILASSSNGAVVALQERGYNGSTPATHATGKLVIIDPAFTRLECLNALRAIISKLYAWGLYRRVVDSTLDFTTQSVLVAPTGTKKIHKILVRRSTTDELYVEFKQRGTDWVEYHEFDPIKFQMRRGGVAEGQDMYVTCIKDFTLPDDESDNLTTGSGLSETLQEDLPMAVAGQVLKGREIPRVQLDRIREALAAAGVNPGITFNLGEGMISAFKREAVMAERTRLNDTDEMVFEYQRRK